MSRVSKWQEAHKFYHWEGSNGIKGLCRLVNDLGYQDTTHFGQFQGASYGDLILFLEDNPGAVEAIVDFIDEFYPDEEEDDLEEDEPDDQAV